MFPFTQKNISDRIVIREFKEDVSQDELVWHQDREDRQVKVIKSNGWKLQLDNCLPIVLKEGHIYKIPAYLFHRVIKGDGSLLIKIYKGQQNAKTL